jgi:hypothetical protein
MKQKSSGFRLMAVPLAPGFAEGLRKSSKAALSASS